MELLFGFLRRHWNGEYSLARSYWVHTLLISLFAPALGLYLRPLFSEWPARLSAVGVLFFTGVGCAAWLWAVRGTWRSATKSDPRSPWPGVVKVVLILGLFWFAAGLVVVAPRIGEQAAALLGKQ